MSFVLRKLGIEVAEIGDVAGLCSALSGRIPELIFLDLNLGGSGGIEAISLLAARGYKGRVQIMSGRSQSVLDGAVALGAGRGLKMLPPLAKPFRMAAVRDLAARLWPQSV